MYKRKRKRVGKRKRVRKQRGSGIQIHHLPPFKILRAIKTIHNFNKQKGAINKIKFAYNKLK